LSRYLQGISVVPAIKKPEDAIPRTRSQHNRILRRTDVDESLIVEGKEKCFVPDDRSAEASHEIVNIVPIGRCGAPLTRYGVDIIVVAPCVGVERAVSHIPYSAPT